MRADSWIMQGGFRNGKMWKSEAKVDEIEASGVRMRWKGEGARVWLPPRPAPWRRACAGGQQTMRRKRNLFFVC